MVIITSDLHLRYYLDVFHSESSLPKKLFDLFNCLDEMVEYARKLNIKDVIIAGDINDTKDNISATAFSMFREFLLKNKDIHWYLLHGNHDVCYQGSVLNLLTGLDNVELITNESKKIQISDYDVLFVPYMKLEQLIEVLRESDPSDVLIGHFDVSGAVYSSGITVNNPITVTTLKNKFSYSILGHIHKPQQLSEKIFYVGSPIQLRRDECDEDKRFLVLQGDNIVSVNFTRYERFRKYVINTDDEFKRLLEQKDILNEYTTIVVKCTLDKYTLSELAETTKCKIVDEANENMLENEIEIKINSDIYEQLVKYLTYKGITGELQRKYLDVISELIQSSNE